MEAQTIREMKLGKSDIVTDMNRDIYSMELLQEQENAEIIDQEAYGMDELPDDDDYGDDDGDEAF